MGLYSKHVVEVDTIYKTINGKTVQENEKRIESLGRGITRTTNTMTKFDKKGNEIVTTTERNTRGLQKFQMEQLGVMFGGMALNRAMSNLNATAREWTGMNELMATAMGVVMLPATMDLMNFGIIPLFNALTNLPEPAQKAIGNTALALEGLGGVMMVGGQLALGLSSTMIVLEKMGGAANAAKKGLKGLAGISLVGVGVSLGVMSITAEDGVTTLITALGSGIAIGLGTVLLGASATTGIALGAIVVTGLLTWKMSSEFINKAQVYDELGKDIAGMEDFISGEAQKKGIFMRGTRQTVMPGPPGLEDFQVDLSKINGGGGSEAPQDIKITQQNTITGFDMDAVKRAIEKNNQALTSEVRRIVKT